MSFLVLNAIIVPLGLLEFAAVAEAVNLASMCWRDSYDAQRCCKGEDPTCWDAIFTQKVCCPSDGESALTLAGRGNPSCWQDGYTYTECCVEEPKLGCWDTEFGPEKCCMDVDLHERSLDVTKEEMIEAYVRSTASASDGPLGCEDKPLGFWRMVKVSSAAFNTSRQYGLPGERPAKEDMAIIVRHVRSWIQNRELWEASKLACPLGALNAIDLSVAYIDRELGEEEASKAYRLHQSLRSELIAEGSWPPIGDWPLLSEGLEYVPRMLGLSAKHSCHNSAIRIYVYKVAKLLHMQRPVLTCSQKMSQCTASVHIHRWLESGSCVADDPREADLFYLPAYEACYNETACGFGISDSHDTERCFPNDFSPAEDLPHWAGRSSEHVFVFGCNLLPLRDNLMIEARQSIMVTVESFQAENSAGPNMLAWLSHWKDVVIPGYIPAWRITAMLAFNRPMIQRSILVAFHGHSSSSTNVGHMYKRSPLARVRDRVIEYFWNQSDASVGPPVRDYFRRMGMSRFCLIPAGLTAWTIHLYESFFFGCVPVILSDELTVPFQSEIDWRSLSIQVPTTMDMMELHVKLQSFSLGRLKTMYRKIADARCWFDYSQGWGDEGDKPGCSPYQGLLTALEHRVAQGRSRLYSLAPGWEPPPRT